MRLAAAALAVAALAPASAPCTTRVLPGLGRTAGVLEAVAFASRTEGWAVGDRRGGGVLLERWDGRRWVAVASPYHSRGVLTNVAATPGEAWAVGSRRPGTLVLHRVGGAWAEVPSPDPVAGADHYLTGVARLSATDAWAVGAADRSERGRRTPLIEHWDGATWRPVSGVEPPASIAALNAVAALAPNDVWAVGYADARTFVEHWDGSTWTRVPSPNGRVGRFSALLAVAVVSPRDIWAVGDQDAQPLAEHWDGMRWRIVPTPRLRPGGGLFWRVAAASRTSVWAVGERDRSVRDHRALVERWDGRRWRVEPESRTGPNATLLGAAARSGEELVAVGFRAGQTLGIRCLCRR